MEYLVIAIGFLLLASGIIGSIVPFIPGPPLAYLALIVLQFREEPAFSTNFLVVWALITLVVTLLDFLVPMYGTKKMGGSNYGLWGCSFGLLLGFWWPPFGFIVGPFLGAFAGELLANKKSEHALLAALGSFIGFVFGTLMKLVTCFMMGYYFIQAL